MTITQTLDKLEEHLAGIIPAFIMLGVVVFILLGLGSFVAPASASLFNVVNEDITFGDGGGRVVFEGYAGYYPVTSDAEIGDPVDVDIDYLYSFDITAICSKLGLGSHLFTFDGGTWTWGPLSGTIKQSGSEYYLEGLPATVHSIVRGTSNFYSMGWDASLFDSSLNPEEYYIQSIEELALYTGFAIGVGLSDSMIAGVITSCEDFYETPVILTGHRLDGKGDTQHISIKYDSETDTYIFTLERNDKPSYVAIKGYVFGFIPVYTYTTVQDESLDLSLSGLPSRFLGLFDIEYTANVYTAGGGVEGDSYVYRWTRSQCVDDSGNYLEPDISGTREEPVDFDSLVKPPQDVVDKGYDTPGIEDIDHDGIHNSEDDDMDGDGISNEEDDEPYNPNNNGILGSLGFTPNFTLPDIESITDMMRNMKLPASLKEMFNIPLPDEYKAGIAVEEGHVLYGYQQLWFGLGDGVIGLFMGIILVIAALIACIPRFLWEFFASLIEWLNVAFQNFYDWLVIPSEIFKLVVGLLPDELLAIALLLFGIDLVFLFFRFVIPGLISGSRAVGDIAQKEEEIRSYEDEIHGKRGYK